YGANLHHDPWRCRHKKKAVAVPEVPAMGLLKLPGLVVASIDGRWAQVQRKNPRNPLKILTFCATLLLSLMPERLSGETAAVVVPTKLGHSSGQLFVFLLTILVLPRPPVPDALRASEVTRGRRARGAVPHSQTDTRALTLSGPLAIPAAHAAA